MQIPDTDPPVCSKTSCIQIFYGLWVNLAEIGIGLTVGFSAVAVPQLQESDKFEATLSELAWIASVLTLSSPLGCLTCGLLIDRIGRRMMQVISQLPMAIGWWYTALSTTPKHLIIGRIITGIGVGMSAGPIRIYTTEISLPNMRGVLGAFPNMAISIGITVTASMGAVLKWTTHCYICGLFATFLMIIFYFLPETPYHVLMRDTTENYDNARRALKKFRSKDYDLDSEMVRLVDYKNENEIRRISLWKKIQAVFQVSACKPFFIVIPYILAGQGCGISIMMFWTLDILEASNLGLNIYLCNIGLGVTRIFSGLFTSILMYYFGRRPLALISGVGLSTVCFSVGGYLLSASSPAWYPQLGYMFYMLFASLGFYTLPLLIMFELYPLLLRGFLGGITVSFANLFIFSANKIYPFMKASIGLAKIFIVFGVFALLGTIFLYFFLPETKDLTLQEIEEYFNKKRATLVSERRVYSAQWQSRSQQGISSSIISVNKSRSLEHHKASSTHLQPHSGRKLDAVNKDFDMHHPIQEAPSNHFKSSEEDIEEQKRRKNKYKTDVVKEESSIESVDLPKKDSLTLIHEHKNESDKDVDTTTKETNENASGARVTIDPKAAGTSATTGHVTINPVASTYSGQKSGESTKQGDLPATNHQDTKRPDDDDSESDKNIKRKQNEKRQDEKGNKKTKKD